MARDRAARRAGKRFGFATIAVGTMLTALAATGAVSGASVRDSAPDPYKGNPKCSDFGYALEFKIDEQPEDGTYAVGQADVETHGLVDGDTTVTITNAGLNAGRFEFDWSSNKAWDAVLVKQANGGLKYEYLPPAQDDQNVQTVDGQNSGGISHVSFCSGRSQLPPTGSVTLAKDLDGTGLPATSTEFEFSVTCESGTVADSAPSISPDDGAVIVATDVAIGDTCTITETAAQGAVGTAFTVNGGTAQNGTSVVVPVDDAQAAIAVVAINTFEEQTQAVHALSASEPCAEGGVLLTIANSGDADGTVDVLNNGSLVQGGVNVPAGGSTNVLVPVAEDTAFDVEIPGVASFAGTRDCVEVEGTVVTPADPKTEVQGKVVARELPRTGSGTTSLALVGLGLVLLGAGAVLYGRSEDPVTI